MSSNIRGSHSDMVFGDMTAFQMLRAVAPGELAPLKSGSLILPERPPRANELRSAIAGIERMHPGLCVKKPVHVLVRTAKGRASEECKPHVCTRELQRSSFCRLDEGVLLSKVEHAFVLAARGKKTGVSLLELGWELCGSYQTARTGAPVAYGVEPLTSVRALHEYVARNHSLDGARKVARILPYLADGSASARETKCALVLGLSPARGGCDTGIPRMNYEVIASPAARAISGKRSFRCDLCWPEAKLDVEYQSRENHEGEANRIRDSRRANALAAMGWMVIGVTNDELNSVSATDAIAGAIRRRLGLRFRTSVSDYHARKLRLRRQLGLPAEY